MTEKVTSPRHMARVGKLKTAGQIISELGKIYRLCRRGQLKISDAAQMARILEIMQRCQEASELERRLDAMESAIGSASVVPFRKKA